MRLAALPALAISFSIACGSGAKESGETGSDCVDGTGPSVAITNDTPWTMTALQYGECGKMQSNDFPFPPPGLEPGDELTVPLPGPGCYVFQVVEPSGCALDPAIVTPELDACSSFELDLEDSLFICPGA